LDKQAEFAGLAELHGAGFALPAHPEQNQGGKNGEKDGGSARRTDPEPAFVRSLGQEIPHRGPERTGQDEGSPE
jgi:hypothetical protein